MEIRTRKIVRRYVSNEGGRTCKRPQVYDHGEYYYRRYAQRKPSEEGHSPTYRIIEPREPLRPRSGLNTLWRRDPLPVRSQPFKMRLPYIKRMSPAKDDDEPKPRGRARSPRLFVVDPAPDIRHAGPKYERARSLSPEIRCISPRRQPSRRLSPRPIERERETITVSDDNPRRSRSLERPKGPRPPRERTPVIEREPVRQRQRHGPARTVQIHQSPERERARSGSSGRRQVRFSEDIDYREYRSPARGRYDPRQLERDGDVRDEIRRRGFERTVPEDNDDRPRYRRLSPERATYRRGSPSRTRRTEATVRSSLATERGRLRPRIIQDGDREISEAGDRIYSARRKSQDRAFHGLTSHSSSRWRRRFDNARDFSSEDESYLYSTGSRRYGGRWR
ncbi:hypothetical protein BDW59DRAFT_147308 [Aspergillus cavernicola]|uniref:Uncharacterized protein n=1 Tax=Aspergillus cavernicola TaxID=176166 RepID=A0ABR4ICS4_9EURO